MEAGAAGAVGAVFFKRRGWIWDARRAGLSRPVNPAAGQGRSIRPPDNGQGDADLSMIQRVSRSLTTESG